MFGICYTGCWSVGYVFLMEQLPRFKRHMILWIDMSSSLCLAWNAFYISRMENSHFRKDWRFFPQINLAVILVTNTVIWTFSSDSPLYLMAVGRRQKAFEVLKTMASWNKSQTTLQDYIHWRKLDTSDKPIEAQKTAVEPSALMDGLRSDSKLLTNFIIMMCLWTLTSINYYLNMYRITYLDKNGNYSLYFTILMLSLADFLAFNLNRIFYSRMGIKVLVVIAECITLIGAIGHIFAEKEGFDNNRVMISVLVFLIQYGQSSGFALLYWSNNIFPVQYASQTITYCNLSCRIFTILAPLVSSY